MKPISFDPATKTMFFVPAFFKEKKQGRAVSWRTGMRAGTVIQVGTALGDIFWNNGDEDVILAPVAGTILRTNRKINHANLSRPPPQFAVVLE